MAVQVTPDNPDNTGQVPDKTRTDTDTPLRGVRCPDCPRGNKKQSGGRVLPSAKTSIFEAYRQRRGLDADCVLAALSRR
jgi:hypothetical protein